MKELQLTIFVNVGLLSVAKIFLLRFVSAEAPLPNRCPKENPYPFRNRTFCCSRPVDFQWQKDGYCYGRSQKCTHTEGCVNYHPLCTDIDSLTGIDFPLDEYNTIYDPTLIPTSYFSHKFIFQESPTKADSENHCIWRADSGKWIMGLCQNIESNIGHYYLDIDSECPDIDDSWKGIENNKSVDGKIKKTKGRVALGTRTRKSPSPGIKFVGVNKRRRRKKVRKCLDWKKIPYINEWRCFKFFPRIKKPKVNDGNEIVKKKSNCKVNENSGNIECGSQDAPTIKDKEIGNKKENRFFDLFRGDKEKNDSEDKQVDNTVDTDDQEKDYNIDSILYDIFE